MLPPCSAWPLSQHYVELPEAFYTPLTPAPVSNPVMKQFNENLARSLGFDVAHWQSAAGLALLVGNCFAPGVPAIAQAYAGHQFGHFTLLGDGRAVLLGDFQTDQGDLFDLHLKGAGPTPYARRGDGRAALGPMLREYLISEAMHALGIPTTRSLAVVATGDIVLREAALPGAVLARVAISHIRVGTFEFAATQGVEALQALADFVIARHAPDLRAAARPYVALLRLICERQAKLVAQWMQVGFVHGVLNTDNVTVSGETIDYGPCAFMDTYDPATVFSSIDRQGRYAYGQQPRIMQWNLARLAESLLPLFDADANRALAIAQDVLGEFPECYQQAWHSLLSHKIGVQAPDVASVKLAGALLDLMWTHQADFTDTFSQLSDGVLAEPAFNDWHARWLAYVDTQPGGLSAACQLMQRTNPVIVPRNQWVQAALDAAVDHGNYAPFEQLHEALKTPYSLSLRASGYARPPAVSREPYITYCGT